MPLFGPKVPNTVSDKKRAELNRRVTLGMGLLDRITRRREPTVDEIRAFNRTRRGSARVAQAAAQPGADKSPFQRAKAQARAAERRRGRE